MRSIAILAACAAFTVGTLPTIVHAQATGQTSQTDAKTIWEKFKGSWTQTKGAVKEQWGKLTDDDLDVIAGKRDQLLGRIQERHGIAKDEAERQVETFERRNPDYRLEK
jgi:uncharacterized protein YjbJ (UPF0337 family)